MTYPNSYYEDIRGRIRGVLFTVAPLLPASTYTFVSEELDANELGIALETLIDVLAEVRAALPEQVVQDLSDLVTTMEIDYDVRELLGSLIVEVDEP